jgi:hypothetical protein
VQCLIEVIRSSGEEMWHVDAYQIPYYRQGIEGEKKVRNQPKLRRVSRSSDIFRSFSGFIIALRNIFEKFIRKSPIDLRSEMIFLQRKPVFYTFLPSTSPTKLTDNQLRINGITCVLISLRFGARSYLALSNQSKNTSASQFSPWLILLYLPPSTKQGIAPRTNSN